MRIRHITYLLACAALFLGCQEDKSERVLLIEASTLAQTGHLEEARAIFESVREANPTSPDVLIRYAGFLIDTGDLAGAAGFFETLDGMELRGTDRGRANTERRRYYQAMYDGARGEGPAGPAEPEAYEAAVIGLINVERAGPMLGEYNRYLIMQARASLGWSPEDRIPLNNVVEVVDSVSEQQARAALGFLDRLIEGDDRAEVREELEPADLEECETLRTTIRVKLFRDEFNTRWSTRYRDAFVRDGRFDVETNQFTVRYAGAYEIEAIEPSLARLTYHAQTWHAREIVTDIAYELAALERDDAAPLPFSTPDFANTIVSDVGSDAESNFVFNLAIPYATVQQGAYLLHRRLVEPEPESEGSGVEPDVDANE